MKNLLKPVFKETRSPGDVCVVALVDAILVSKNHTDPNKWKTNPTIVEALTKEPKLQIFLINRYWRQQLGKLSIVTIPTRFALADDASTDEYLQLFKVIVAPVIVANGI